MNARQNATIAELEAQRTFLGTRAAAHAGEAAELREALQAAVKERDALKAENDDLKAKHDPSFVLPATIAVAEKEGGHWIPFEPGNFENPRAVHAIKFGDGTCWDAINGWRRSHS